MLKTVPYEIVCLIRDWTIVILSPELYIGNIITELRYIASLQFARCAFADPKTAAVG